MRRVRNKVLLLIGACGVAAVNVSCQERIVNYKPFFSGIEGAQTQTPGVSDGSGRSALRKAGKDDDVSLVHQNKDGTVSLISKSGRQLMMHIQRTIAEDEAGQFTNQVLSEITRAEYHERGLDPVQAFEEVKKNQKEIAKLFNRMPLGEHSPNVMMDPIGRNMFRVRVTGQSKKGLEKWTGFDMVFEKGNWRLRWFVG